MSVTSEAEAALSSNSAPLVPAAVRLCGSALRSKTKHFGVFRNLLRSTPSGPVPRRAV